MVHGCLLELNYNFTSTHLLVYGSFAHEINPPKNLIEYHVYIMRHRTTFIHSRGKDNGIESLNSTYVEVVPGSTREDRLTYDAPSFSHISSLRIQVIKPFQRTPQTAPFTYDYQIGLHIYIVPKAVPEVNERQNFYAQVNSLLKETFDIELEEKDWILSLNSLYYHTDEYLKPHGNFAGKLPAEWDALDYSISEGTAVAKSFQALLNDLQVDAGTSGEYKEVGVFGIELFTTRDDLVLSGARVVFNDDDGDTLEDESKFVHRTLFHVKPRHRQISSVPVEYVPNGLHPIISLKESPERPEDDDLRLCKLYYYAALNKNVFFDRYQTPEALTTLTVFGTTDLELPEYLVSGWGNEILMEVDPDAQFPIDLTLHTRYQLPKNDSGYTDVIIEKPLLFYGCETGSDSFLLKNSPFDNKAVIGGGYEKFFTDDTVFYRALEPGAITITVPTAHGSANWVNLVTMLSVLLGIFIIVSKVFGVRRNVDTIKKNQ